MNRIDAAKTRLKNRVKRLSRLVELDAPAAILIREIKMVEDTCWLIDENGTGSGLAGLKRDRVRRAAGYCLEENCTAQTKDKDDYYCTEHQPDDAGLDPADFPAEDFEDN